MDVDAIDDIDRIQDLEYMEEGSDLFTPSEPESVFKETGRQYIERRERDIMHGEAASSSDRIGPNSAPECQPEYYGCPPYPGVRFIAQFPGEVFIPKNDGRVYHTRRE